MVSWRDQILREFSPGIAKLTLVADPDALLLEESILEAIRERGFELIPYQDAIEFRYAFESGFRSRWDAGEETDLVVLLRLAESALDCLPYDLLQVGRKLSFFLGDIFPNLSYLVVEALDRGDFDSLFEAQRRYAPGVLGDNATKEFVLRHVFQIAPELILEPSDLLRVLLRRHYRGLRIPSILDNRFIELLRQNRLFNDWPLELIVQDKEAFFTFLQERWPMFLDRMAAKNDAGLSDGKIASHGFSYPGPANLPFDHHDVRVFIDNLFLEGMLHPVSHAHTKALSTTWAIIGIKTDGEKERVQRLYRTIKSTREKIPEETNRHDDWSIFARIWAEMLVLVNDPEASFSDSVKEEIEELTNRVDDRFTAWLQKRYASLVNLPPAPPVMLHHIPRFMARYVLKDPTRKAALLLIDGLSLEQWIVIRDVLSSYKPNVRFRETTVYSWIPTITPVARQAAFAGKAPVYFPNSIHSTSKDSALWSQFWIDQGLSPQEIIYQKSIGNGEWQTTKERIADPGIRVVGLVANQVDDIMHGMVLGASGMQSQVRQWAKQPFLANLLDYLLENGFQVFLTSDHGNIQAVGCGRPLEGAAAEIRGERVRVYSEKLLRGNVRGDYPESLEWNTTGLPVDYLPLIAPKRKAFVQEDKVIVCHGGISIEEVIVPLVVIERKSN
jgi:hypothetical protein